MFDYYLELIPRSEDSVGKSIVKSTYQRKSNYREIYSGGLKISDAGVSQKKAPEGGQVGPTPNLGAAQGGVAPSYGEATWDHPPPRLRFRVYLPPGKPRRGDRP